MKKLHALLLMVWLAMPASAQFGKLLKDVEKGIKDVKKTTGDASRTAKNTQKGVEDTRKTAGGLLSSASNGDKESATSKDLPSGRDFYISLNGNGREATKINLPKNWRW